MIDYKAVPARAAVAGTVLVAVGLVGLVPGVDRQYGDIRFAGGASGVVHLLLGLAGVASARTEAGARAFLGAGGVTLLGLWFLGAAGLGGGLSLRVGDNWLHFVLGIALLGFGALPRSGQAETAGSSACR